MKSSDVDTTEQRAALSQAQDALSDACASLAVTAKQAAKTVRRGSAGDVVEIHALYRAVVAAEEAVDIAATDLAAANGEDV